MTGSHRPTPSRAGARRRRGSALLAAATALLPLLAGAASADAWDDVIAAAKTEGKVTIYTGTSHPLVDAEIAAFQKQYPEISFDILDGEANDLNARIDQEVASGSPVADVYISTDSLWIPDANERGVLKPLAGPSAAAWPEEFRVGDSYKMALIAGGILINTDLVKRKITGYGDLVGEEFANGMLGEKRWSSTTSLPFHKYIEDHNPGVLDKLAAQHLTIYRSSEAGTSSVASGELAGILFTTPSVPLSLIAQGAPIAWILPKDPWGLAILVNVVKGAPHPNAAQLFADFLLSEEGQKIWNPEGSGQASPLGFGDFDPGSITLLKPGEFTPEEIEAYKAVWEKRFGG